MQYVEKEKDESELTKLEEWESVYCTVGEETEQVQKQK